MSATKTRWRLAVAATLVFTACGKDSTSPVTDGTGDGSGSITISLSGNSLGVEQGADGTVTATIGRSGSFTGPVGLSMSGAPSGVTATASPSTVASGGTSSTITVAAGSGAAAGTSTLTVRATGSGVSDATATLTLTVTAVSPGSYSLSVSPATLSIQQGSQATSTVAIARDGFTGAVALAVSGAPSGMTATLDPASTEGNSSTLTVAAGGSVAAADYTLTVTGTASGLDARTATLTVTVTAPAGGSVVWQFCPAIGLPAWFAYQDGAGAWTQAAPDANSRYVFDITSGRGGVAYAFTPVGQPQVQISYGTRDELNLQGSDMCGDSGTGKTVNGTVANVGASDQANISLGESATSVFGSTETSFELTDVPDGNVDLIASRSTVAAVGTEVQVTFNKGIIRRGLNPPDGSTLPVLDFESSEAFAPVDRSLTIDNLGSDAALVSESFFTSTGTIGLLYAEASQSMAATRTFKAVPDEVLQAGDLNLLTVTAADVSTLPTTTRSAVSFFAAAADQTLTLGPDIGAVTVTSAGASPYVMPRIQYSVQSGYDRFFTWIAAQSDGMTAHTLTIGASSGYLAGTSAVDLTMPDFSSIGFDASWALAAGTEVKWSFGAIGWTMPGGDGTGLPYVDGAVGHVGTRAGTTVF